MDGRAIRIIRILENIDSGGRRSILADAGMGDGATPVPGTAKAEFNQVADGWLVA